MNRAILYVDDIAERLGITPNAVRLRVARQSVSIPKPLPKSKIGGLAWRARDFDHWLDGLDRNPHRKSK